MIQTLIADDEAHARERLIHLLERFTLFEVIAEASDGNEALHKIITLKPDVAFLDIHMPGISVFQSIPALQHHPLIIFQTAYSEHAAQAFEIDALDYLLKPVRLERLEKTVKKIREKLNVHDTHVLPVTPIPQNFSNRISVTLNGKTTIIENKDIIRISFENGICVIYTVSGKYISDKYLNFYEDKLNNCGFFRTSRTDIINLLAICSIQREFQGTVTIELKNGMSVDVSRRRVKLLKKFVDL